MLAIRMQRTGRKGHAQFRVVVQDSRFAPNSGRVVAKLGHHNPHTKETVIDKSLAEKYLSNGAQPSPRVVRLFEVEKVTLPNWVDASDTAKKRSIKNPEKLRKNRPAEPEPEAVSEQAPVEADGESKTPQESAETAQNESDTEEKPAAE